MNRMGHDLHASDIKHLLLKSYVKYKAGRISASDAYKESYLLNSILKAIQVTEIERKLETIESILKNEKSK